MESTSAMIWDQIPLYIAAYIIVMRTCKLETLALSRARVSTDPLVN
jgi:hypothetical protein